MKNDYRLLLPFLFLFFLSYLILSFAVSPRSLPSHSFLTACYFLSRDGGDRTRPDLTGINTRNIDLCYCFGATTVWSTFNCTGTDNHELSSRDGALCVTSRRLRLEAKTPKITLRCLCFEEYPSKVKANLSGPADLVDSRLRTKGNMKDFATILDTRMPFEGRPNKRADLTGARHPDITYLDTHKTKARLEFKSKTPMFLARL